MGDVDEGVVVDSFLLDPKTDALSACGLNNERAELRACLADLTEEGWAEAVGDDESKVGEEEIGEASGVNMDALFLSNNLLSDEFVDCWFSFPDECNDEQAEDDTEEGITSPFVEWWRWERLRLASKHVDFCLK